MGASGLVQPRAGKDCSCCPFRPSGPFVPCRVGVLCLMDWARLARQVVQQHAKRGPMTECDKLFVDPGASATPGDPGWSSAIHTAACVWPISFSPALAAHARLVFAHWAGRPCLLAHEYTQCGRCSEPSDYVVLRMHVRDLWGTLRMYRPWPMRGSLCCCAGVMMSHIAAHQRAARRTPAAYQRGMVAVLLTFFLCCVFYICAFTYFSPGTGMGWQSV